MAIHAHDEVQRLIDLLLIDYGKTLDIGSIDCNIVLAEDMETAYKAAMGSKIETNPCPQNIQQYHGLTLPPATNTNTFTILLNCDYVDMTMNNLNWISTFIHEVTHVCDFRTYYSIISAKSFDELFDKTLHPIFNDWTEFHAMAVGHYFLRKYVLEDFKGHHHINNILYGDLPKFSSEMANEFCLTSDENRLKYVVVRFLGRLAVWQYLYPAVFNSSFIDQIFNGNKWMNELFIILTSCDSLEGILPHFGEIQKIWNSQF